MYLRTPTVPSRENRQNIRLPQQLYLKRPQELFGVAEAMESAVERGTAAAAADLGIAPMITPPVGKYIHSVLYLAEQSMVANAPVAAAARSGGCLDYFGWIRARAASASRGMEWGGGGEGS